MFRVLSLQKKGGGVRIDTSTIYYSMEKYKTSIQKIFHIYIYIKLIIFFV